MTREEIMMLGMDELEERRAAIATEAEEADAEALDALNAEIEVIEERTRAINLEIEESRKAAEAAQAQALEQARREAAALAQAQAQAQFEAQAQRDEMAAKAAEAKAQAAEEIKNEFPPAESPELVFGSDQGDENRIQ